MFELNEKLKEELEKVIKSIDLKQIDWDTFKVIATNASVDRDWEIISLDGWDIENYLKNPVIIANHNYQIQNLIWKATNIYSDWKNIIVEWIFSKTNPLWILARDLYNEWILKAVSVWFISKQRDEENRDIILKKELLELSFVAVPCNPEAISLDGKWLELYKKWVEAGLIKEDSHIEKENEKNINQRLENIEKILEETSKIIKILADDKAEEKNQSETLKKLEEARVLWQELAKGVSAFLQVSKQAKNS